MRRSSSGNINIVIVGGSSTIKSEFLNFVSKNFPNSIELKSNKNKVILSPKIVFDKYFIKRYLDPGQIALLKNGISCNDRIEKLNNEDKLTIEEVLKDQKITFYKQGIYEIFNINCSILATANPKSREYNVGLPIYKTLDYSNYFIFLFDLYFVIIYKIYKKSNINKSINNLPNIKNKTQLNIIQNNILPIDFLRKYIYYAKAYINPQLTNESREFISKCYMILRKYSIKEQGLINPITVRTLNSLIKISTAFAKCRLSQKIEREDCEDALELLCDSIFSIGEYEDEGDSDIEEIEEEYQEIKNKSIINKKEKKEKNEDNIKEKIIPLKEEEDEVIEQNKNKKNKLNIKEKKEKEKEKIIKKNEMNNVIDNTQTEIDKELSE